MDKALITFSGSTGLVGIDTGNQDTLVRYFIVDCRKAVYVVADGIFIVGAARTDDQEKLIAFPRNNFFYFRISFFFQ